MYRDNIFKAVNRNPRVTYHLHESFIIAPKYVPFFRNLIIECPKENWRLEWYTNAAVAIEKLVTAKTPLQSLTMVVSPQRVGTTQTAAGWEKRPVTFADFFWLKGRLMRALKLLSCKTFNIVIKKTIVVKIPAITLDLSSPDSEERENAENGENERNGGNVESVDVDTIVLEKPAEVNIVRRFIISLDLTYLSPGVTEVGQLANDDTVTNSLFSLKSAEPQC